MSKEKFIEIAKNEVGYLEKATNSQLNDKTANAGYNNWTKYGAWYGMNGPSAYWCDIFVSWCAHQAGIDDIIGKFAYCPYHVTWFKNRGQWVTSNPQIGDIIFFKDSNSPSIAGHVGIVYSVNSSTVYTYEGNTSGGSSIIANGGGVFAKSYSTSNSRILGYGRPSYTFEPDKNNCPYDYSKSSILKKGSTGSSVLAFQWYANEYGETTGGIDGQYGAQSVRACKNLQNKFKLASDGECGPNTWNALINNYTEMKGELTMSQYTELLTQIENLKSQNNSLTKIVESQISPVYTDLVTIKSLAPTMYDAAKWMVDKGYWKGEDDKGTLNKCYLDLKSAMEIYRVMK